MYFILLLTLYSKTSSLRLIYSRETIAELF